MLELILIEPETPGNIGAIARTMANFGFKKLVIVSNKFNSPVAKRKARRELITEEAKCRAKHAQIILKNAKFEKISYIKTLDLAIATTAKTGGQQNILRVPLTPVIAASKFQSLIQKRNKKIGVVIGRESDGLYNSEVKICDFTMHIPASEDYPTMNISHAVSIILYEFSKSVHKAALDKNFKPMTNHDKLQLEKMANELLDKMHFNTDYRRDTQKVNWKNLIGKSSLSHKESHALMGFFGNLLKKAELVYEANKVKNKTTNRKKRK